MGLRRSKEECGRIRRANEKDESVKQKTERLRSRETLEKSRYNEGESIEKTN